MFYKLGSQKDCDPVCCTDPLRVYCDHLILCYVKKKKNYLPLIDISRYINQDISRHRSQNSNANHFKFIYAFFTEPFHLNLMKKVQKY